MQLTEENKKEIKKTFRRKRNKQLRVFPLVIVLWCLLVVLTVQVRSGAIVGISFNTIVTLFFMIVIVAQVFTFINWRCPVCNKYLGGYLDMGRPMTNPKFCPKCGTQLQDN